MIDALVATPDKAEVVAGELVRLSPTGYRPGRAALRIVTSLYDHERRYGNGRALGDNVGYLVELPNRQSFSPDASWYVGPPGDMRFLEGAPAFAAEVRSESDYGVAAEAAIAAKRADYFAAGALVVWDVDLVGELVVRAYPSTAPGKAVAFRRGQFADAEPAVPGWWLAVDDLFD
jgi:Uma2 family endonuclease